MATRYSLRLEQMTRKASQQKRRGSRCGSCPALASRTARQRWFWGILEEFADADLVSNMWVDLTNRNLSLWEAICLDYADSLSCQQQNRTPKLLSHLWMMRNGAFLSARVHEHGFPTSEVSDAIMMKWKCSRL